MKFILNGFTGINNVDGSYCKTKISLLKDGTAILSGDLKSSVNFRITKDNLAEVRNGFIKRYSANTQDFWTNKGENLALFVEDTVLKRLEDDLTAKQLKTGLTSGKRMCYIEHEYPQAGVTGIYMGNGEQMLKYNPVSDSVSTWGDTSNLSEEFESPQRQYIVPPKSNILLSYNGRTYVADGRFLLYSEMMRPETFRRANNIPVYEDITALSCDLNHIYIHTFNTTTVLRCADPTDRDAKVWTFPIGAVKHGAIMTKHDSYPRILTKRSWAICHDGIIEYIDFDNFRLNIPPEAEAYLGFNEYKNEIIACLKVPEGSSMSGTDYLVTGLGEFLVTEGGAKIVV